MPKIKVKADRFPPGTQVQAYPFHTTEVERREGRMPIPAPTDEGILDANREIEIEGPAGMYTLFAVTGEVQEITVDATGGKWIASFGGDDTAELAYNISAANLKTALTGLESIGSNNVSVTGGPGDSGGTKPYVVTFLGDFIGADVAEIEVSEDEEELTGGGSKVSVKTATAGSKGSALPSKSVIFSIPAS